MMDFLSGKQRHELLNYHPGAGVLFINLGDGTYSRTFLHLGRNGYWYAGASPIDKTLQEIAKEVKWEIEY